MLSIVSATLLFGAGIVPTGPGYLRWPPSASESVGRDQRDLNLAQSRCRHTVRTVRKEGATFAISSYARRYDSDFVGICKVSFEFTCSRTALRLGRDMVP